MKDIPFFFDSAAYHHYCRGRKSTSGWRSDCSGYVLCTTPSLPSLSQYFFARARGDEELQAASSTAAVRRLETFVGGVAGREAELACLLVLTGDLCVLCGKFAFAKAFTWSNSAAAAGNYTWGTSTGAGVALVEILGDFCQINWGLIGARECFVRSYVVVVVGGYCYYCCAVPLRSRAGPHLYLDAHDSSCTLCCLPSLTFCRL